MSGIDKLQFDHAQILYILDIGLKKIFYENLLILSKFHKKTLSRPGDIKIFRPGKRMYTYTLPPFMEAVLSEERHLMKWVGIFQMGIFWVGIFRGEGGFPRGEFDGWEFS